MSEDAAMQSGSACAHALRLGVLVNDHLDLRDSELSYAAYGAPTLRNAVASMRSIIVQSLAASAHRLSDWNESSGSPVFDGSKLRSLLDSSSAMRGVAGCSSWTTLCRRIKSRMK